MIELIRTIVDKHISDKEQKGIVPACCTRLEIMEELSHRVTEAMRQLHYSGEYIGRINISKTPMLIRNGDMQNRPPTHNQVS